MNRDTAAARRYHAETAHSPQSVRSSGHTLDWDLKPSPFKIYPDLAPLALDRDLEPLLAALRPADYDRITQLSALREFARYFGRLNRLRDDQRATLAWLVTKPQLLRTLMMSVSRFDSPEQEVYLSLWRTYDRLRALEDEAFQLARLVECGGEWHHLEPHRDQADGEARERRLAEAARARAVRAGHTKCATGGSRGARVRGRRPGGSPRTARTGRRSAG